jgi:hypothetical protein
MQRLRILQGKLDFICWFFAATTSPLTEIKRKIDVGLSCPLRLVRVSESTRV